MIRATIARKLLPAAAVAVAALATVAAPASSASAAVHPDTNGPKQFGRMTCNYGSLCVEYNNGVYQGFYKCQRIYLSGWTGEGGLMNNQYVGTVTKFYDQNGKEIKADRSTAYTPGETFDWDPVWSIQVC